MTKTATSSLPWLWLSAVVIVLDQYSKWLAETQLVRISRWPCCRA